MGTFCIFVFNISIDEILKDEKFKMLNFRTDIVGCSIFCYQELNIYI